MYGDIVQLTKKDELLPTVILRVEKVVCCLSLQVRG